MIVIKCIIYNDKIHSIYNGKISIFYRKEMQEINK